MAFADSTSNCGVIDIFIKGRIDHGYPAFDGAEIKYVLDEIFGGACAAIIAHIRARPKGNQIAILIKKTHFTHGDRGHAWGE